MQLLGDDRAQSVVIGSLLIFTILILAFSGYQAFAVPNQNAQVEVDHFQDTEEQFSELRSNIITAVGSNETRSVTFKLGTRYPTRIIALNPPAAAGRLETTDAGNVSIIEAGTTMDVCSEAGTTPTSRSLVYTPGYNEYAEPVNISYENRMIARQFDGGGLYDQRLIRASTGNDQISLFLLTGTVSENGIDSYSLEVNGSNRNTVTLMNPNVTVPSSVGVKTWNDEIVEDRTDVTVAPASGDRVTLNFTGGDYEVSCAVVGLDSDPAFTPPDDGGSGGGGSTINPNAPGDIRLNGISSHTGSEVRVEFENLASSDTDAIQARINFYQAQSGEVPTNGDIAGAGEPVSANLEVGGGFEDLDPDITFAGGETTDVVLDFDETVNPNDWFVLTMQYDNDEVGQYFISLRDEAGSSSSGNALAGATAGDIGTTANEQQEFTFDLGRDLTSGEVVTIDLSDAQSGNGVDYSGATVTDDAAGSANITQTGQSVEITYTADGTETDGTTVTVTAAGVDATGSQAPGTYDAVFEGPDGTSTTEKFEVA